MSKVDQEKRKAEACQELENKIEEEEEKMPNYIQKKAHTTSAGKLDPGEDPLVGSSAVSYNKVMVGKRWQEYAPGKKPPTPSSNKLQDEDSNVKCGDFHFEYVPSKRPRSGHAEAKIIESLFQKKQPKGTLYLKINWVQKNGTRNDPCPHCERLIKEINQNCKGLKIELCD